jgi:hypothetical protein
MRLRRRKTEPTVTFYPTHGDPLEVPDSQIALANYLFNELAQVRATVIDLNTRLMQLEGDEYEDDDE